MKKGILMNDGSTICIGFAVLAVGCVALLAFIDAMTKRNIYYYRDYPPIKEPKFDKKKGKELVTSLLDETKPIVISEDKVIKMATPIEDDKINED
jgi:hypothetical protein